MPDPQQPPSRQQHAVYPAQAPPPFPDPKTNMLSARRVTGAVLVAPPAEVHANDHEDGDDCKPPRPTLERTASVAGNVLLVDMEGGETKAYLLQRKIKSKVFGTVRVGYLLKDPGGKGQGGMWEVAPSTNGVYPHEMVAVAIEDKSKVLSEEGHSNTAQDPKTELSALQMVAAHDREGAGHVIGTSLIASDQRYVYIITPYHKEGSLYEYCTSSGTLSESDARFFFRQILKGLETLQSVELCHRDLSLENVCLKGTHCTLMGLTTALRIPTAKDTGTPHMIEPQPPCASNPQYIAPELLRDESFDGYAVDMWAAGVMLYTMLLGADSLFIAPVMEDRRFNEICVEGNLRQVIRRRKQKSGKNTKTISDDAIDLLQGMLRADAKARMTLADAQKHAWVAFDDGSAPPKAPVHSDSVPES